MILAIITFIVIWIKSEPKKLVSVTKKVISTYMASMINGWIIPTVAAFVKLILEVVQNTSVLTP